MSQSRYADVTSAELRPLPWFSRRFVRTPSEDDDRIVVWQNIRSWSRDASLSSLASEVSSDLSDKSVFNLEGQERLQLLREAAVALPTYADIWQARSS